MIDWTKSMQQTYEYYIVDPGTWKDVRRIHNVVKTSIDRDSEVATLGSACIDITGSLDECYIRVYLVAIQNGLTHREPLGTFLVQTPSTSFDGKVQTVSLDAYTPLLELKESLPPWGYSLRKGQRIMPLAYQIVRENARAPVVSTTLTEGADTLTYDFVANTNDTWLSFTSDLIANIKYEFALDEMGRILFSPKQDAASLQPIWTYDSGNSSILYSDLTIKRDLYGVPNVVEVIYTTGSDCYYGYAENNDPNSPISTVSRGRRIVHRVTDPDITGRASQRQIQIYAEQLLKELSSVEYTITYEHGYCPVRPGDCVRINHPKAGLDDVKAKIISQNIKCESGCPVKETAIYTMNFWKPTTSYVISYDSNGGANAPGPQMKGHGIAAIISTLTIPTKDGSEFKGWGTEKDSTAVSYKPGDLYTDNNDIKLYAIWG
jgi:hypothetical protein